MNNAILNIPTETKISIIIGDGGDNHSSTGILGTTKHTSQNGGTTSFDTYLSATGGKCATSYRGADGGHANNGHGGGGGGYGLQGFGHGGGGSLGDAMKGVCILSYSKLVES